MAAEEKKSDYQSQLTEFVYISGKRKANPHIKFDWPVHPAYVRGNQARAEMLKPGKAQTAPAQWNEQRAIDLDTIYKDFNRFIHITDTPEATATTIDTVSAYVSALIEHPDYRPLCFAQGDFMGLLDLTPFIQGRLGGGAMLRAGSENPMSEESMRLHVARQTQHHRSYFYLKPDPNGGQPILVGVTIACAPPTRIGKEAEGNLPECLGISVVEHRIGESLSDANVHFFFDALSGESVSVATDEQHAEDAQPPSVKTDMNRTAMLEKLRAVMGNDKVFQLIQYHMNHPDSTSPSLVAPLPFGNPPETVHMDPRVVEGVNLVQSGCKAAQISDAQFEQLTAANKAFEEAFLHRQLLAQQQQYATSASRVTWAGGTSAILLWIIHIFTELFASKAISSGSASALLGISAGLVVPGALFFLFLLGRSAQKDEPIPLIAFGWAVAIFVVLELVGMTSVTHEAGKGLEAIATLMSKAGPAGYAVFGIAAGLTILALAAYGYCTKQAAKFEKPLTNVAATVAKMPHLQSLNTPPGLEESYSPKGAMGPLGSRQNGGGHEEEEEKHENANAQNQQNGTAPPAHGHEEHTNDQPRQEEVGHGQPAAAPASATLQPTGFC